MSFPSDVLLPANAKYYGFIDNKNPYNINWDLTWSFSFALTGTEHLFCTFLTYSPISAGNIPGQYAGYLSEPTYLTTQLSQMILSENGNPIIVDDNGDRGVLGITFDTTGLFALSASLSSNFFGGVPKNQIIKNSLVIRDSSNNVIYNQALSSLDSSFFLTSSSKNYQTLRFRVTNSGRRLIIDKLYNNIYNNLLSIPISTFNIENNAIVYPGFSFCSPVSSLNTPSTLFLKNFHVQGNISPPTYDNVTVNPLYIPSSTVFTTISGAL